MELALLTGEVGSGKTLLTRALVDRLGDRYEVGMILNPRLSPRQFLRTTARDLGVEDPAFHTNDVLDQIQKRLLALDAQGRAAVVIVDEAHLIPGKPTFEEIRLLTNFQLDDRNLITVVLVGQPELRERLRHRTFRALTQRLGAEFHLVPLSLEDVREYVRHRLRIAGATRELFDEPALRMLHEASGGIPRVLNHLASQALIEGMARGVASVSAEVAAAAMADRDLAAGPPVPASPSEAPRRRSRGPVPPGASRASGHLTR